MKTLDTNYQTIKECVEVLTLSVERLTSNPKTRRIEVLDDDNIVIEEGIECYIPR